MRLLWVCACMCMYMFMRVFDGVCVVCGESCHGVAPTSHIHSFATVFGGVVVILAGLILRVC